MISIYTDGSSTGKSDLPGGWAWTMVQDGVVLGSGHGGDPKTTNNKMELLGAIRGLEALIEAGHHTSEEPRELVSDSQYTLGMASGQWKPKKNLALVLLARRLAAQAGVSFRWVKGHSKNTYNEICDELAKKGKEDHTNP